MKLRINLKEKKKELQENKHLFKENDGKYSLECNFCLKRKIKINRNNHIRNRNKVKFWNNENTKKVLICSSCLYDRQELEIKSSRKVIFNVYKVRYLEEDGNS